MFTLDPWVGCKRESPWDRQETKTETKEWWKQLGQRWLGYGKWAQLGLMFFFFVFIWGVTAPGFLHSLNSAILPPPKPWDRGLAFPQNYPDSSEVTLRVLFRARLESPKLVSCDTVAAVYERDLWSLLVSRWRWCFVKTAVMGQTSPCSVTELLQHEPLHIFYNVTLRSEIEPLNGTDSASAQTQMWMIGGPVIPIWCVLLCHCCSNSHFQKSNVCAI